MLELKKNIQFGDYLLDEFKGEGSTAQVWSGKANNGESKAIKIFAPRTTLDNHSRGLLKEEFEKTKRLSHKYLLIPEEYIEFNNVPALVMPLCDESLWQILKQKAIAARKKRQTDTIFFTEREMVTMLNHLSKALEYLHSKLMIHNDVKPGNILVKHNGAETIYYLTDFGITKEVRDTILRQTKTHSLTFAYASPEKLKGKRGTFRSDLFSLGAAAYELINGLELDVPLGEILNNSGDVPPIKKGYSEEFESLILGMLAKDPAARFSATDVAEHTDYFIENNEWSSELRKFDVNRDTALLHDDTYVDKTVLFRDPKTVNPLSKQQETPHKTINIQQSITDSPKQSSAFHWKPIIAASSIILLGLIGYNYFPTETKNTELQDLSFLRAYQESLTINDSIHMVFDGSKCGVLNQKGQPIIDVKYRICEHNKELREITYLDSKTNKYSY